MSQDWIIIYFKLKQVHNTATTNEKSLVGQKTNPKKRKKRERSQKSKHCLRLSNNPVQLLQKKQTKQ
jgi:hypothetical protein